MGDIPDSTAQSCDTEVARLVTVAREGGEPDVYPGKRQWVRYQIGMKLEATRDPSKASAAWPVVTHNISGGGLGFSRTTSAATTSPGSVAGGVGFLASSLGAGVEN